MIQTKINLPKGYRLDLNFIKRRGSDVPKSLLPKLNDVLNKRKGNIISRYFRHVFEHNNIKKVFGVNMAILAFGTSLIPSNVSIMDDYQDYSSYLTQSPLVFKTETGVQYPVEKVSITQGYKFYHPGIDLDGITGDEIKPIISGVVYGVFYSRVGYGNHVLINHGNNVYSLYAHLSKIKVNTGDEVTKDSIIGEMGATGRAFGDHLHLEIYENGKRIDPLSILVKYGPENRN